MRWRGDFLASRGDLPEAPVTLPAVSISYEGRMCRRRGGHAKTVRALIPGTASPVPIKHLKSNPAWQVLRIKEQNPATCLKPSLHVQPCLVAL